MNRFFYTRRAQKTRRSERGMTLIITLLILVAMLLVSTALLRSSDTSVQVVNNLSFRQAAEAAANMAVERFIKNSIDVNNGLAGRPSYYYCERQPESPEGIPARLLAGPNGPGTGSIGLADMNVTYIFERMCSTCDEAMSHNCVAAVGRDRHIDAEPGRLSGSAIYRVSFRIDSVVGNTTVFANAFIH